MVPKNQNLFQFNKIYFITFAISSWVNVYINDQQFELVRKWLGDIEAKYNNKIYGYVIMPNHVHILLNISDKSPDLQTLIFNLKQFLIKETFSILNSYIDRRLVQFFKSMTINYLCSNNILSTRFECVEIKNLEQFINKLNYIHHNPCRKNWLLVDKPYDYKYSSIFFHRVIDR